MHRFAVTLAVLSLCLCQTPVLPGQQRFVVSLRSQDSIEAAARDAAAMDDPDAEYVIAAASPEEKLSLPLLATVASGGTLAGHTDSGELIIDAPDEATAALGKSGLFTKVGFDAPSEYRQVRGLVLTYDVANKPSQEELAQAGVVMIKDSRDELEKAGVTLGDNPWDKVGYMKVDMAAGGNGIPAALAEKIREIGSVDKANANVSVAIEPMPLPRRHARNSATISAEATPTDDPAWSELWGMGHIHAPSAWAAGRNVSPNVIVAVVDTGIDYDHPDLEGNMWRNASGEVGFDFANGDANPMDDHGHGTHCAGTIAAVGNNGQGVVGVTWDTKLMALKFLKPVGDTTSGDLYDAALCIRYAIKNKAQVISNSWETPFDVDMLRAALDEARSQGIIVVAAAGNVRNGPGLDIDTTPRYPASYTYKNLISVAALQRDNTLAGFSNYGEVNVDLAAPGVDIYSTIWRELNPPNPYGLSSGTSMAAPHVSGALALMLADPRYRDWKADELCEELREKVQKLPRLGPSDGSPPRCVSGGALDLAFLGNDTVQSPLARQSFHSDQFSFEDNLKLNPRGGAKLAQITIEIDQPVTLHIRANASMRIDPASSGSYAHMVTGFSPSNPPEGDLEHVESMPWKESLRPVTVIGRKPWVNFGSVFSVRLNTPGKHTVYWYTLHSRGARIAFGSGSMIVDILGTH